MAQTFNDRLVLSGGRPVGFDYMRIALAMGVIVWHSFGLSYGFAWAADAANNPLVKLSTSIILPAFFTLSGFLVSGSLERSDTLTKFAGLRVIRIVPALGVEIILSAFVLGPLITSRTLQEYLTDPDLYRYLGNIFGFIHYQLPGVFEQNPIPNVVNGQLWTIKWELRCYIAIVIIALIGLYRNGWGIAAVSLLSMPALIVYLALSRHTGLEEHNDVGFPGSALVISFLMGVAAYRFKDAIAWSLSGAIVSLIAYCVLVLFVPYGSVISTLPIAYLTLFLGLWNGRKTFIVRTGDYSYGIYIYGFAIQQAIVATGAWARHWWIVLPLTTLIAGSFAAFSWFAVEKPSLALRRYLPRIDRALGSLTEMLQTAVGAAKVRKAEGK